MDYMMSRSTISVENPPSSDGKPNGLITSLILNRLKQSALWVKYQHIRETRLSGSRFIEHALAELNVQFQCFSDELQRIPSTGPVIVIANHPFGALEGLILALILSRRRPDFRILANKWLSMIPEIADYFFWIDPFGTRQAVRFNATSIRHAVAHVQHDGLLAIFPAGEVSHLRIRERRISDPPWQSFAARLAHKTNAKIVPVFFGGVNSLTFQLMGLLHPRLRTLMLPRELMNKSHTPIRLRIGNPITLTPSPQKNDPDDLTRYFRARTYCLGHALESNRKPKNQPMIQLRDQPIGINHEPIHLQRIRSELYNESTSTRLTEGGDYEVFLTTASQSPTTISEIGILREYSFRAIGEGTGEHVDLDRFDEDYLHLVLWHKHQTRIAGAYRLGCVDRIVPEHGMDGIYTSTLFKFKRTMPLLHTPSLELGRSFILPEFQKSYWPLLLMWRGISRFLVENPRYRYVFGPISISPKYHPRSVQLILSFLDRYHSHAELKYFVTPRVPFAWHGPYRNEDNIILNYIHSIDALSDLISEIEPDAASIPVLVRQYLNLGGKIIHFNVDPQFNWTTDALVVVDLQHTPQAILQKFMGREGYARWSA